MKKRIRHQQQLLKKRITKIKNKIRYVSIYFFLSMFTAYVVIGKYYLICIICVVKVKEKNTFILMSDISCSFNNFPLFL